MKQYLKVIGFDADDTLWMNETYYRETEQHFVKLLQPFEKEEEVMRVLMGKELENLSLYGYGAKGFMLSMIETVLQVSDNGVGAEVIDKIIELGKELLDKPVILLDGAREVLQQIKGRFPLILATKGDLLDQERKLRKSGLDTCFHDIEIMSDKKEENYRKLLKRLNIKSEEFMMVGNSLKSDVLPLLKLGAWGVHVPYHTTWVHEETDENPNQWERLRKLDNLTGLIKLLDDEANN